MSGELCQFLLSKDLSHLFDVLEEQITAKSNVCLERCKLADETAIAQQTMDLAMESMERKASSWLTTPSIEEHGFCLYKGTFVDALALRYGWTPSIYDSCVCSMVISIESGVLVVGDVTLHAGGSLLTLTFQ